MAKFAAFVVLAVLALQNSNATINLPDGVTSFPEQIKEVITKHNTEPIFEELKKEVEALLATNDKDERLCGPKAFEFISTLVKDSQTDIDVCVNHAEDVAQDLQDKLSLLDDQANAFSELLADKIIECGKHHPRDLLGFAACVEENTKDLREKLEQLEMQMTQVSVLTLQSIKEALKDLDVCLAKDENKITLEGRAIVYGLNQCIQNVDMLYTRNSPNEINKIIIKHNVDAVIKELKKEVEGLLNLGERIERLCGPSALNLVEELSKEALKESNQCLEQTSNDLEQFDVCLAKVENKVTLEGRAIVYNVNQCIQNADLLYTRNSPNEINKIIIKHNVDAVIKELKKEVKDLLNFGERIERLCGPSALNLVEELTKKALKESNQCLEQTSNDLEQFDVCLAKVENKVTLEGRAIVYNVNQCIQNVGMLYSRNLPDQMNKVVAEHNFKSFFDQIKNEIEKLLATSEKDERLCGPKAHKIVELLEKDSQIEAQLCLSMASHALMPPHEALNEVKLCLNRVEDQIISQGKIIFEGLKQCIRNADMLY